MARYFSPKPVPYNLRKAGVKVLRHVFPLRRCLMSLSATVANNVLLNYGLSVECLLLFVPSLPQNSFLQQSLSSQSSSPQRWTRVFGPSEVKASL